MNGKFGTAINCMDGRVQLPVIEWLKRKYSVDFVDMITEPGPNKILSDNENAALVESIKRRVEISAKKHRSKLVAVVGHYDCAGNPVEKDVQLKQIRSAVETVRSWDFGVQIVGLWVDGNWEVNEVELLKDKPE